MPDIVAGAKGKVSPCPKGEVVFPPWELPT